MRLVDLVLSPGLPMFRGDAPWMTKNLNNHLTLILWAIDSLSSFRKRTAFILYCNRPLLMNLCSPLLFRIVNISSKRQKAVQKAVPESENAVNLHR